MNIENLKGIYENVSKKVELPDFDTFMQDMASEDNLKNFHSTANKYYEMPDYGTFKADMGFADVKKKELQPNIEQPIASSESVLQPSSEQAQLGNLNAPPPASPIVNNPDGGGLLGALKNRQQQAAPVAAPVTTQPVVQSNAVTNIKNADIASRQAAFMTIGMNPISARNMAIETTPIKDDADEIADVLSVYGITPKTRAKFVPAEYSSATERVSQVKQGWRELVDSGMAPDQAAVIEFEKYKKSKVVLPEGTFDDGLGYEYSSANPMGAGTNIIPSKSGTGEAPKVNFAGSVEPNIDVVNAASDVTYSKIIHEAYSDYIEEAIYDSLLDEDGNLMAIDLHTDLPIQGKLKYDENGVPIIDFDNVATSKLKWFSQDEINAAYDRILAKTKPAFIAQAYDALANEYSKEVNNGGIMRGGSWETGEYTSNARFDQKFVEESMNAGFSMFSDNEIAIAKLNMQLDNYIKIPESERTDDDYFKIFELNKKIKSLRSAEEEATGTEVVDLYSFVTGKKIDDPALLDIYNTAVAESEAKIANTTKDDLARMYNDTFIELAYYKNLYENGVPNYDETTSFKYSYEIEKKITKLQGEFKVAAREYLLNESPATVKKDWGFHMGELYDAAMAQSGEFGTFIEDIVGTSDNQLEWELLYMSQDLNNEYGIPQDEKMKEVYVKKTTEYFVEGFGTLVPMAFEFFLFNKAAAAVGVEKLIADVALKSKFGSIVLGLLKEEVIGQTVGLEPGMGAGFGIASKVPLNFFKITSQSSPLKVAMNRALNTSLMMTSGAEVGNVTSSLYTAAITDKTFMEEIDKYYGQYSDWDKRVISGLILNVVTMGLPSARRSFIEQRGIRKLDKAGTEMLDKGVEEAEVTGAEARKTSVATKAVANRFKGKAKEVLIAKSEELMKLADRLDEAGDGNTARFVRKAASDYTKIEKSNANIEYIEKEAEVRIGAEDIAYKEAQKREATNKESTEAMQQISEKAKAKDAVQTEAQRKAAEDIKRKVDEINNEIERSTGEKEKSSTIEKELAESTIESAFDLSRETAVGNAIRLLKFEFPGLKEQFKGITQASFVGAFKNAYRGVIEGIAKGFDTTINAMDQAKKVREQYRRVMLGESGPDSFKLLSEKDQAKWEDRFVKDVMDVIRKKNMSDITPEERNAMMAETIIEKTAARKRISQTTDGIKSDIAKEKARASNEAKIEKINEQYEKATDKAALKAEKKQLELEVAKAKAEKLKDDARRADDVRKTVNSIKKTFGLGNDSSLINDVYSARTAEKTQIALDKLLKSVVDNQYMDARKRADVAHKKAQGKMNKFGRDIQPVIEELLRSNPIGISDELMTEYADVLEYVANEKGVVKAKVVTDFIVKNRDSLAKSAEVKALGISRTMSDVMTAIKEIEAIPEANRTDEQKANLEDNKSTLQELQYADNLKTVDDFNGALDAMVKSIGNQPEAMTVSMVTAMKRRLTTLRRAIERAKKEMLISGGGSAFDGIERSLEFAEKKVRDTYPELVREAEAQVRREAVEKINENLRAIDGVVSISTAEIRRDNPKWYQKKGKLIGTEETVLFKAADGTTYELTGSVAKMVSDLISQSRTSNFEWVSNSELVKLGDALGQFADGNFTPDAHALVKALNANDIVGSWSKNIIPSVKEAIVKNPRLLSLFGSVDKMENLLAQGQIADQSRIIGIAERMEAPFSSDGVGRIRDAFYKSRGTFDKIVRPLNEYYASLGKIKNLFNSPDKKIVSHAIGQLTNQKDFQSNMANNSEVVIDNATGKYKVISADGELVFMDKNGSGLYETMAEAVAARKEIIVSSNSDKSKCDYYLLTDHLYFDEQGNFKTDNYKIGDNKDIRAELSARGTARKVLAKALGFKEGEAIVFENETDFNVRMASAPKWLQEGWKVTREVLDNPVVLDMMRAYAERSGVRFTERKDYSPHMVVGKNGDIRYAESEYVNSVFEDNASNKNVGTKTGNVYERQPLGSEVTIDMNSQRSVSNYLKRLATAYDVRPVIEDLASAFSRMNSANKDVAQKAKEEFIKNIEKAGEIENATDRARAMHELIPEGLSSAEVEKVWKQMDSGTFKARAENKKLDAALAKQNPDYIPFMETMTQGILNDVKARVRNELGNHVMFAMLDNIKFRASHLTFSVAQPLRAFTGMQIAKWMYTPVRIAVEFATNTTKVATGGAGYAARKAFWRGMTKNWGGGSEGYKKFLMSDLGSSLALSLKQSKWDNRMTESRMRGKSAMAEFSNLSVIFADFIVGRKMGKDVFEMSFKNKTGAEINYERLSSDMEYRMQNEKAIKEAINEVNDAIERMAPSPVSFGRKRNIAFGIKYSSTRGGQDLKDAMTILNGYNINESTQFILSIRDMYKGLLGKNVGYNKSAGKVWVDAATQASSLVISGMMYTWLGRELKTQYYKAENKVVGDDDIQNYLESREGSSFTVAAVKANIFANIAQLSLGSGGNATRVMLSLLYELSKDAYVNTSVDKKKAEEEMKELKTTLKNLGVNQYTDFINIRKHQGTGVTALDIAYSILPIIGEAAHDIEGTVGDMMDIAEGNRTATEKELNLYLWANTFNQLMILAGLAMPISADIDRMTKMAGYSRAAEIADEKQFEKEVADAVNTINTNISGELSDRQIKEIESYGGYDTEKGRQIVSTLPGKAQIKIEMYRSGAELERMKAELSRIEAMGSGKDSERYKKQERKIEIWIEALDRAGFNVYDDDYSLQSGGGSNLQSGSGSGLQSGGGSNLQSGGGSELRSGGGN